MIARLFSPAAVTAILLPMIAAPASLQAEAAGTAFHYGPDSGYISTGFVPFTRRAELIGSKDGVSIYQNTFSDTVPLIAGSASYAGPAIYGGYRFSSGKQTTGEGKFTFNEQIAQSDPDAPDIIKIQPYFPGEWGATSAAGVLIFRQDDFDNGFGTGRFALEGLFVTTSTVSRRWVIQQGGQYYISKVRTTYAAEQSLAGEALHNMLWAPYNPAGELEFDAASATFQPVELQGITAVGIYWESSESNAQNSGFSMTVTSFTASGSINP